ncbi:MAG: hypothetical protein MJZ94_00865 [Bacteroidales bacterium]|nr:hypothetical protein [Bacteroidales bacterium]
MKTIFVNLSDLNTLNYDGDNDQSWKGERRLSKISVPDTTGNNKRVCLYGLNSNKRLELGQYLMLQKITNWADLYVTDYRMPDGYYPLFLNEDYLYFTNVETYSHFDAKWALDNIYRTRIHEIPAFISYQPSSPNPHDYMRLESMSIKVNELYDKVKELFPAIREFCQDNQGRSLEITYRDRYVVTEFSLIICLQFIQDLIRDFSTENYRVKFVGQKFNNSLKAKNERDRLLINEFISDAKRDEVGKSMLGGVEEHYVFVSEEKLPHYRELEVKVGMPDGSETLRILPDGGLALWKLDNVKAREERKYYKAGNGIQGDMPIFSSEEQLYYVCRE